MQANNPQVFVSTSARFYAADQLRDKGKFADEGRGRQPGGPAPTPQSGLDTKTPAQQEETQRQQPKRERVNMGVTPARSNSKDVEETMPYYNSTRYKGWLTDLKSEANRLHVQVEDVVKVAGVWLGTVEPSASVWVSGDDKAIHDLANSMGQEYNQDGVMLFTAATDKGDGALYTMRGIKSADDAIAAMRKSGIDGGRVVQGKGGEQLLEIADFDGSLHDNVVALSKQLGLETYWTPGNVEFLNAGEHYQRRSKPYKGSGITHASVEAAQREQASTLSQQELKGQAA